MVGLAVQLHRRLRLPHQQLHLWLKVSLGFARRVSPRETSGPICGVLRASLLFHALAIALNAVQSVEFPLDINKTQQFAEINEHGHVLFTPFWAGL